MTLSMVFVIILALGLIGIAAPSYGTIWAPSRPRLVSGKKAILYYAICLTLILIGLIGLNITGL
jgi:hypothetical protein